MEILQTYFPRLTSQQIEQFGALSSVYDHWNAQINVISRKDIEFIYERHVLHSLSIHKFIQFSPGSSILDIGTGGGFPGIPLAIMHPDVHFTLTDSIGKKIKVVKEVSAALGLKNVTAIHTRSESMHAKFDFVVSRAVAEMRQLIQWSQGKIKTQQNNAIPNGIICLKGGDLNAELSGLSKEIEVYDIHSWFNTDFFETKKLVYAPMV